MADFEHLKSFCGPKELQELSSTFAAESATLLIDLSQSINSKDADRAKRLAHQLKGLAATLAADDMQKLAASMESHIKESNWQPAAHEYEQLAETVVQVNNDLKNVAFPDKL